MAERYEIADGFNNAGSLYPFVFQPQTDNISPGEMEYYADGRAGFLGSMSTVLRWTALSPSARNTVMTQLGLSESVPSNEVTIRLHRNDNTFDDYNAIVYYNIPTRRLYGWENLEIDVIIQGEA